MSKYLLEKNWSDSIADYTYTLSVSNTPTNDHSCYVCYDDWWFRRRKCHYNTSEWTVVAHGDKKWAKAIAKHYKITEQIKD